MSYLCAVVKCNLSDESNRYKWSISGATSCLRQNNSFGNNEGVTAIYSSFTKISVVKITSFFLHGQGKISNCKLIV